MTKRYAVPGLRLGYVTGAPHLLHRLRTNRMPWSVNQLAIEAGLHLLEHDVPNPLDVASYLQEAARLRSALEALGGLEVWATETHFMLVCLRMGRASALKDYLAGEHGILIRDASNFDGLNEHFFRIAAQSREENDRLVKAIGQWLRRNNRWKKMCLYFWVSLQLEPAASHCLAARPLAGRPGVATPSGGGFWQSHLFL